jgi:hypothetical protein
MWLSKHHNIKIYGGVEMNGYLHAPTALPPRKESLVPIGQEAGWAPVLVWTQWQRNNFSPCQADPAYPDSHYTDWATLAYSIAQGIKDT